MQFVKIKFRSIFKSCEKMKFRAKQNLIFPDSFWWEKKLVNIYLFFSNFSMYLLFIKEASICSSSLILWFW